MGRTLHYSITKRKGNFTRKELEKIYSVSLKYNSGNYSVWSCENFFCNPYDHYPNWNGKYKNYDAENAWKDIYENIGQLIKAGNHYYDAVLQLHTNKEVLFHNGLPKNNINGFVKVQGNELNSLMVLMALIEISQQCPATEIELSDEGEFLLCDLKIRKGKAMPMIESITNDIQRYCHLMMFSDKYDGNILSKLDYKANNFSHEFQMDFDFSNSYGDMTMYVNEKLRNLKEIETALISQGLTGKDLYLFNMMQRECKDWFCPYAFTRKVDIEKFVDYKRTPATLMDGFSGEGFGLTTEDSELKSYQSIAQVQKLLDNPDLELKILGE
jgi:hypothetical protein